MRRVVIFLTVILAGLLTGVAVAQESTVEAFCLGQVVAGTDAEFVSSEESPCPDDTIYQLYFAHDSVSHTMLLLEWETVQEVLSRSDVYSFLIQVIARQDCDAFQNGETLINNARSGLYRYEDDLRSRKGAYYFHDRLEVVPNESGDMCQRAVRNNRIVWFYHVTDSRGNEGWVSSQWVHIYRAYYIPTDEDLSSRVVYVRRSYEPVLAPWDDGYELPEFPQRLVPHVPQECPVFDEDDVAEVTGRPGNWNPYVDDTESGNNQLLRPEPALSLNTSITYPNVSVGMEILILSSQQLTDGDVVFQHVQLLATAQQGWLATCRTSTGQVFLNTDY